MGKRGKVEKGMWRKAQAAEKLDIFNERKKKKTKSNNNLKAKQVTSFQK